MFTLYCCQLCKISSALLKIMKRFSNGIYRRGKIVALRHADFYFGRKGAKPTKLKSIDRLK